MVGVLCAVVPSGSELARVGVSENLSSAFFLGFDFGLLCSLFKISGPAAAKARKRPERVTKVLRQAPGTPRNGTTAIHTPKDI